MFLSMSWGSCITRDYEMTSSPDTLRVIFTRFASLVCRMVWESIVLGLPDLAGSSWFLQLKRNFLNLLASVLWSTNVFGCFCGVMSQFELVKHKFSSVTFTSQTEWTNNQHVSAPTTMILPTAGGTFGHVIKVSQTSTYQNIAKHLTHPSKTLSILTFPSNLEYFLLSMDVLLNNDTEFMIFFEYAVMHEIYFPKLAHLHILYSKEVIRSWFLCLMAYH